MKYVSLVLLGLLMAVLAGCSGGDGGKNNEIADLKTELQEALDKLSTTQGTLKTTQGDLTTTQGDLTATQGTLSTTREALEATQGELSETQGTLKTTQDDLTTTQGDLTATQGTLSKTQEALETTQDTLSTTREALKTTQGELSKTEGELSTARKTLKTTQDELATAQQNLATEQQNVNNLLIKASAVFGSPLRDLTALDAKLGDHASLQESVDDLLDEAGVASLSALSDKLKADGQTGQSYAALRQQADALLARSRTVFNNATLTTLTALSTELDAYTAAVNALQTQAGVTSLAALNAEIGRLQREETRLNSKVTQLGGEVQKAKQEAEEQQTKAKDEETRAEAITRAFELLRAMDTTFRTSANDDQDPSRNRSANNTALGTTHPMEAAPRSPKITNLGKSSVTLAVKADGEFKSGSGIPSLSMGGTGLRSALRQRTTAQTNMQELAFYTDFKPINIKLLDAYFDERPADPDDDTQKLNVITLATAGSTTAMGINEKTGDALSDEERFANAAMYEDQDKMLVLQPGVSKSKLPRTGSYTLKASDYTVAYEYVFDDDDDTNITDDDHYDIVVIRSFRANLRGVSGRVQFRYPTPVEGMRTTTTVQVPDPNNPGQNIDQIVYSGGCTTRSGTACRPDPPSGDTMSFVITTAAGSLERYAMTGTAWTFRPDSASATIYVDDGHYLYFGWWQETPDQADGLYDLHLIADGVGRWGAANYALLTGQAVYTGPAVGKYVRTLSPHDQLYHAGEDRRQAVAGTFTADARLEANFTDSNVKGTITNFRDGSTAIPGGWRVNLGQGDTGTTATAITFANTGTDLSGTPTAVIVQEGQGGGTITPTETQTGRKTWSLMFFADEDTAALNALNPPVASQPLTAVGSFDVGLDRLIHFSGAFGVKRTN